MPSQPPDESAAPGRADPFYDADYEFRHHLYSALILLGCKKEIADLLEKSQDYAVTEGDVNKVRQYCIDLEDGVKNRLRNVNTMQISPMSAEEFPPE